MPLNKKQVVTRVALPLVSLVILTTHANAQIYGDLFERVSRVASQLFIAHIEAPNGKQTTKKFAVAVGR